MNVKFYFLLKIFGKKIALIRARTIHEDLAKLQANLASRELSFIS